MYGNMERTQVAAARKPLGVHRGADRRPGGALDEEDGLSPRGGLQQLLPSCSRDSGGLDVQRTSEWSDNAVGAGVDDAGCALGEGFLGRGAARFTRQDQGCHRLNRGNVYNLSSGVFWMKLTKFSPALCIHNCTYCVYRVRRRLDVQKWLR